MLNIGEYVKVVASGDYGIVLGSNKYGLKGKEKYMYNVSPIGGRSSYPFKRDELIFVNPKELINVALDNKDKEEFDSLLKQFGKELFQSGGTRK